MSHTGYYKTYTDYSRNSIFSQTGELRTVVSPVDVNPNLLAEAYFSLDPPLNRLDTTIPT